MRMFYVAEGPTCLVDIVEIEEELQEPRAVRIGVEVEGIKVGQVVDKALAQVQRADGRRTPEIVRRDVDQEVVERDPDNGRTVDQRISNPGEVCVAPKVALTLRQFVMSQEHGWSAQVARCAH